MLTHRHLLAGASLIVLLCGVGCARDAGTAADASDTSTSTSSDAIVGARAGAEALAAEVEACKSAFEACAAAEGADVASCKTDLAECLPDRPGPDAKGPPRCGEGPHGGMGDPGERPACGGAPIGPPPREGQAPPEGAGGAPPGPPPEGAAGGAPMGPPPGGACTPPKFADSDAMKSCEESKRACLESTGDPKACADSFKSCAHDALAAGFAALCDEKLAECAADSTAKGCAKITEACSHSL